MYGEIITTKVGTYVRCTHSSKLVSTEQDVLDLLTCCGEIGSNKIMLDGEYLHPDFFDLRTGLAGAIFQKFSNYRVKAAIVADLDGIKSKRFQELIHECNQGNTINFFYDTPKAVKWLTA